MTPDAVTPRSKRRTSAIVALLILILLVGAATASAQTPVTACGTEITTPGDYVLAASLDCGTPFGVLINNGSVNFNLNGNGISSTGTLGTGIFVTCVTLVTIQNGKVSGATQNGILVNCPVPTPAGIVIRDMILSQNKKGISFFGASSNTVRDNLIVGTGVVNGIGILLIDGDNSQIDSNITNNNVDRGIWLTVASTGNTIKKNAATGNGNRDLVDEGDCSTNNWFKNTFDTATACI